MTQDSYARLLKGIDLGVAVYFPSRDIKIWDVAYFTGSTHHRLFNVFEIDREVSDCYNVFFEFFRNPRE